MRKRLASSWLALSLALGTTGGAFAQTSAQGEAAPANGVSADSDPVDEGDIIVTARRSEERLADVPAAVQVITPKETAALALGQRDIAQSAARGNGASLV